MKILVLGSGAREHAIVRKLVREGNSVLAAPGNPGIAQERDPADVGSIVLAALDPLNPAAVRDFAVAEQIELVVIGPEAPLVAGVGNILRQTGIPVFGPDQDAAALEGSKSFAKRIMDAAGVPTGRAARAKTISDVSTALDRFGAPYVVKADGLAAGKGVLVTSERSEALAHASHYLNQGDILVEEFLEGPEVSLFFLSDGTNVVPLTPAQDYKRLLDEDEGPNTGGMGAYSPLPWLSSVAKGDGESFGSESAFVDEVRTTVALPTIQQLAREGTPFIGLLYAGLILTRNGIRVIEFNARFGDPETQVVLARLKSPLGPLLHAAATGTLNNVQAPEWLDSVAITVVVASEGYPETPIVDREIIGVDFTKRSDVAYVLHAGTKLDPSGRLNASGGRVLSVVAGGQDFETARTNAYLVVDEIQLEGAQYRRDIAARVSKG